MLNLTLAVLTNMITLIDAYNDLPLYMGKI